MSNFAKIKQTEEEFQLATYAKTDVAVETDKDCLLGIEFAEDCKPIHAELLENKTIAGTSSNPNILRLLPPSCVTKEEIDLLSESLKLIQVSR